MRSLFVTILCSCVAAQGSTTSPPGYATTEGPSAAPTLNPLLFPASRFQYSDTAILGPRTISVIQLRRDGPGTSGVFAARSILVEIVFASSGSRTPTFVANYASQPTNVFGLAQLNLPTLAPPAASPAPWSIFVPLSAPYVHSAASGFLWEWKVASNSGVASAYTLDAHPGASAGTGTCTTVGSATCTTQNGTFSLASSNPVTSVGNLTTFSYSATGGPTNAAAMIALSAVPGAFAGILCSTLQMNNPIVILPAGQTNATGALPTVSYEVPYPGAVPLRAQALALDMSQLIVPLAITQCRSCTPAATTPGSTSVLYSTTNPNATTGTRISSQYPIVQLL